MSERLIFCLLFCAGTQNGSPMKKVQRRKVIRQHQWLRNRLKSQQLLTVGHMTDTTRTSKHQSLVQNSLIHMAMISVMRTDRLAHEDVAVMGKHFVSTPFIPSIHIQIPQFIENKLSLVVQPRSKQIYSQLGR